MTLNLKLLPGKWDSRALGKSSLGLLLKTTEFEKCFEAEKLQLIHCVTMMCKQMLLLELMVGAHMARIVNRKIVNFHVREVNNRVNNNFF